MHLDEEAAKVEEEGRRMRETVMKYGLTASGSSAPMTTAGARSGARRIRKGGSSSNRRAFAMAGIGIEDGSALKALSRCEEYLATDYGLNCTPGLYYYRREMGRSLLTRRGTRRMPGFSATPIPWVIIAETKLDRRRRPLLHYRKITRLPGRFLDLYNGAVCLCADDCQFPPAGTRGEEIPG